MSLFDENIIKKDLSVKSILQQSVSDVVDTAYHDIQYRIDCGQTLFKLHPDEHGGYTDGVVYSYIPYNKYTWAGPYSSIKEYSVKYLNSTVDGVGIGIDFLDIQGSHSLYLRID